MRPYSSLTPLRLALLYAVPALAWVWGSDLITASLPQQAAIQMIKGGLFVAVTSLAFYAIMHRHARSLSQHYGQLVAAQLRSDQAQRLYATLSAANRCVRNPVDRRTLAKEICHALIEPGGLTLAWIGWTEKDSERLRPYALQGAGSEHLAGVTMSLDPDVPEGRGPSPEAIRTGKVQIWPELQTDPRVKVWHAIAQRYDFQSAAALPLRINGAIAGVLTVYASRTDYFSPANVALLRELVGDLERGIELIAVRETHAAALQALRESEHRYRLFAENMRDVIWMLSPELRLIYVSPSVERLRGYTPAEVMSQPLAESVARSSKHRVLRAFAGERRELARHGRIRGGVYEVEQPRKRGGNLWTEVSITGLYDGEGRFAGVLGVTRDISERKRAADELAREVRRYRTLLNTSTDAISIIDAEGRLREGNTAFRLQLGHTAVQAATLRVEDWDTQWTRSAHMRRLLGLHNRSATFTTRYRRRDGTQFEVEACMTAVELDGQSLLYCSARDLTERKALEAQFLRAQRLESIGLLAGGIAHDLNNVLAPVLLSVGMLRERALRPEERQLLDTIDTSVTRGAAIIKQILTFARGMEGERTAVQPRHLVRDLARFVAETFPRNIEQRVQIAPDTSVVTGDPTQLHQVLLNLAVNARDAMPGGGVLTLRAHNMRVDDLQASRHPGARAGAHVMLTVIDSGEGIEPAVLDHIFEPFFTTKSREKGTGLGLSTVHGIVRSHGGFVEVTSTRGQGAEFRVFLPAATTDADLPVPTEKKPQLHGAGRHVLIADDEPAISELVRRILQRHGFQSVLAGDGSEALREFQAHPGRFALVVTDLMMPHLDGARLVEQIRRRAPQQPVVVMSGLLPSEREQEQRVVLQQLGIRHVLPKPFTETQLIAQVVEAFATGAPAPQPLLPVS